MKPLGPGGPIWSWLNPRPGRERWHVRCLVCHVGRVPLGFTQFPGEALPTYHVDGPCHPSGCRPLAIARTMAWLLFEDPAVFLPPPDFSPAAFLELKQLLRRARPVARAWLGLDRFRSAMSRLSALAYRLDAAGARPGVTLAAVELLAERILPVPDRLGIAA